MGGGLSKLDFDVSNMDDSANVGAWIRSSDGSRINHQSIASENWLNVAAALFDSAGNGIGSTSNALDVYLTNGLDIDVDLDGEYSGGNTDPDNVGLISHVRSASPGDAQQTYRSTGGKPDSDNLDPANIHGLDVNSFLHAYDGAAWDRLQSESGALKVYQANDPATADSAIESTQKTVSATGALLASQLSGRKWLFVQNRGNQPVYIGKSGVTTANGFEMPAKFWLGLQLGPSLSLHAVKGGAADQDVRLMELS